MDTENKNDSKNLQAIDGQFRWVYELSMWKKPTIIITIVRILILTSLFPALIVFFSSLGEGSKNAAADFIYVYGICIAIIVPLLLVAYIIVGVINGGKYCIVFEMDKFGVKHIQMKKQFKKAKTTSMIGVIAGTIAGNITLTGSNLLAGSRQSLYSKFRKVKSVVVVRKQNVIYVNENLNHNQIYVEDENLDFVAQFIVERCKKAKVSYK